MIGIVMMNSPKNMKAQELSLPDAANSTPLQLQYAHATDVNITKNIVESGFSFVFAYAKNIKETP